MLNLPRLASVDFSWPPLRWEAQTWVPGRTIPAEMVGRRVRERHAGPYQAAVVPAIADVDVTLPTPVAADADAASTEIARFDAELGAGVAPFAASSSARSRRRHHRSSA